MPSARLTVEHSIDGPFVFAPGFWNDEGHWVGIAAFSLPLDELGRRRRSSAALIREDVVEQGVRRHIADLSQQLRKRL
eukprot:9471082-Karenia_brevis.AAC.1